VSTESNKAVVRRFLEDGLNKGNLAVFGEVFAPDFVWHGGGFGEVHGLPAFMQVVAPFVTAFSGLHAEIEDMMADGDRVTCRFAVRGTHSGDLFGIAPTGRTVAWGGNPTYRIADGLIVEEWFFEDLLALFQQIGAFPAMAE
jgi:predicted ester cyclase